MVTSTAAAARQHDDHGHADRAHRLLHVAPRLAEGPPDPDQDAVPHQAADGGQDHEAPEGVAGEPGGQRDRRARQRDRASHQDRRRAPAVHPRLQAREALGGGAHPVAVPGDHGQAAAARGHVQREVADQRPGRRGRQGEGEGHLAVVDREPGEREDGLARDRREHALDQHQGGQAHVAEGGDDVHRPVGHGRVTSGRIGTAVIMTASGRGPRVGVCAYDRPGWALPIAVRRCAGRSSASPSPA